MREKRVCFTSHMGVLLSPMSLHHTTKVWTFLKLMIMIVHMKMMQTPYLDIWSILISGQVPHRSNSSQLFWNGLFQKKSKQGGGVWVGGFRTYFLEKKPWGFLVFLCTTRNSGKIKLYPCKFGKTMYDTSLANFKDKNQDPWKFHMNFSWYLLEVRC